MTTRVYKRINNLAQIKEEILRTARSGGPRPRTKASLTGRLLCQITCSTSPTYFDADFDALLRAERPDWFTKSRNNTAGNKQALLDLARSGADRPANVSPLGNALGHYAVSTGNASYDEEFASLIREVRPDWFRDCQRDAKEEELDAAIADPNAPRPGRSHMRIIKLRTRADPTYDATIRALRPDWFPERASRKDELIALAKAEGPRPESRTSLYNALCSATDPRNRSFDASFNDTIRALRPEWFVSRRNPQQNKSVLLDLASRGEARPSSATKIGQRLYSYMSGNSASYDHAFRERILSLRPDWFAARAARQEASPTLH